MIQLGYLIVFTVILVALFFGWHEKTKELINETRLNNELLKEIIKELRND